MAGSVVHPGSLTKYDSLSCSSWSQPHPKVQLIPSFFVGIGFRSCATTRVWSRQHFIRRKKTQPRIHGKLKGWLQIYLRVTSMVSYRSNFHGKSDLTSHLNENKPTIPFKASIASRDCCVESSVTNVFSIPIYRLSTRVPTGHPWWKMSTQKMPWLKSWKVSKEAGIMKDCDCLEEEYVNVWLYTM